MGRHSYVAMRLVTTSILCFTAVLSLPPSSAAAAANRVTAFNTTNYAGCPGWGDMWGALAGADGFTQNLAAGGGAISWTYGNRVADFNPGPVLGKWLGSQWFAGGSNDDNNSTNGFDSQSGISMYQGHGFGNNGANKAWRDGKGGSTLQACNPSSPSATCPTAPSGDADSPAFTPAVCLKYPKRNPCPAGESCDTSPPAVTPWCAYKWNHAIKLCGASDTYSQQRVSFSWSSTEMKLGESNNGTAWHPAGQQGGSQMAVILVSHASNLGTFGSDLGGMFAGLDAVASVYTMGGDYADDGSRAPTFATLIHNNATSSLSYLWTLTASMVSGGGGCLGWQHDGTPRSGFNGCGGHVFMTLDMDQASADYKAANLTPTTLQDVNVHPNGTGATFYRSAYLTSNWNAGAFPAILSNWNF